MNDEAEKGPQPVPEQVDFDRDAVDPVPWVGQVEDAPPPPPPSPDRNDGGSDDSAEEPVYADPEVPALDPHRQQRR